MALRASSPQADLEEAVWGDADADTGVERSAELRAFAKAAIGREDAKLDETRSLLLAEIGPQAVSDAAGVIAFFNAVDRIADATGTFLDPAMQMAADMMLDGLDLEKLKAE